MMGSEPYTPKGTRVEGPFENQRNALNADLYKAMIREAVGQCDVIIAHHLVYVVSEKGPDGFVYTIVEEVPSADTLMFNHEIMGRLFGKTYLDVIMKLACEPVETRDALLRKLYASRPTKLVPEKGGSK